MHVRLIIYLSCENVPFNSYVCTFMGKICLGMVLLLYRLLEILIIFYVYINIYILNIFKHFNLELCH